MNRTLIEHERSMRMHAGLPEVFWVEAVNHASYLVNCGYALIPSDERTKLKPKSLECIFLGFESDVKGSKLWDPVNWKKILSRDIVFDKRTKPMNNVKKPKVKEDVVGVKTFITITPRRVLENTPKVLPTEDVHEVVESNTEVEEFRQQQLTQDDDEEEEEAQDHMEPPSIATFRPKKTIKPPQ
ncbi:unnamed protein product [Prunus brigantina]